MFKEEIFDYDGYIECNKQQFTALTKWLKSKGVSWNSGIDITLSPESNLSIIDIEVKGKYYIKVNKDGCRYIINPHYYWPSQISNIMQYMISEYKLINTITGSKILEYSPCKTEFEKFVKEYGFYDEVEWTIEIEQKFKEEDGWIEFLSDKGFINKVNPEIQILEDEIKEYEEKIKQCRQKISYLTDLYTVSDYSYMVNSKDLYTEDDGCRGNNVRIIHGVNIDKKVNIDIQTAYPTYDIEIEDAETGERYLTYKSMLDKKQ